MLAQIADIAEPNRVAHFTCAAALALPDGREGVAEGRLDGSLTLAPRGTNGFGYDPIFVPDGGAHDHGRAEPRRPRTRSATGAVPSAPWSR